MKIAILHNYTLSGSGSSTYVLGLVKALLSGGNEVVVISREPDYESCGIFSAGFVHDGNSVVPVFHRADLPKQGFATGYTLAFVPYIGIETHPECIGLPTFQNCSDDELQTFISLATKSVADVVRREGVDVIHANHIVPLPFIAAQVKRETGVPFIVTLHGSHIEYVLAKDPQRYRPYADVGLREAGSVVVTTSAVQTRCMAYSSVAGGKFVMIPVGVDTTLFRPPQLAEHKIDVLDRVYSTTTTIEVASHVVVFVGKLVGDKGAHLLPLILGRVKIDFPNARMVIVGGGPLLDPLVSFARGTKSALDLFDLAANTRFGAVPDWGRVDWEDLCRDGLIVLGPQPSARVQEILRFGDVCIIPSTIDEALPMVVLEAASSGVVPVARDHSGFREVVAHIADVVPGLGRAAIVEGDTDDFVEGFGRAVVASLRKIDANRGEILAGLRLMATRDYDWRAVARRITTLYEVAMSSDVPR